MTLIFIKKCTQNFFRNYDTTLHHTISLRRTQGDSFGIYMMYLVIKINLNTLNVLKRD